MSDKSNNFYSDNRILAGRDGNTAVAKEPREKHQAPYTTIGRPPARRNPRQALPREIFEDLEPKCLWQLISDFIQYFATDREKFIYAAMIGATQIRYDTEHKYVLNYPGKPVTRQTYHKHKNYLVQVFRGLSLKATNQPTASVLVKA